MCYECGNWLACDLLYLSFYLSFSLSVSVSLLVSAPVPLSLCLSACLCSYLSQSLFLPPAHLLLFCISFYAYQFTSLSPPSLSCMFLSFSVSLSSPSPFLFPPPSLQRSPLVLSLSLSLSLPLTFAPLTHSAQTSNTWSRCTVHLITNNVIARLDSALRRNKIFWLSRKGR